MCLLVVSLLVAFCLLVVCSFVSLFVRALLLVVVCSIVQSMLLIYVFRVARCLLEACFVFACCSFCVCFVLTLSRHASFRDVCVLYFCRCLIIGFVYLSLLSCCILAACLLRVG